MEIGALGLYVCLFIALYFEVFLLISFLEKRPTKKSALRPAFYPTVDILVPCFNEQETVGKTIESLLAMEYPQDKLTVTVVDDGSTDNTAAIAQTYAAKYPNVRFYTKENGGKYTALNFGIENATADIVGCLDADSFVASDALIEVIKSFNDNPSIMAITPAMKVHEPKNPLELMQAVEYTFGIFYKKMFDNLSAISVLPGPFSLYRREVFKKIGLFKHAHNTEDMEIAFRMHSHGLKIVNAHTAYVYTTVPKTVRALVKQRTRWSQGFLQNSKDYAHMFFNRKYGNFGMLVLPFGLAAFAAGLYTAGYMLYTLTSLIVNRIADYSATGIPLHMPTFHFDWFYIQTSMIIFVTAAVIGLTLFAIYMGGKISQTRLKLPSFIAYFALYGFIAPLWLAKAAWGALLARESVWR